MIVNEQSIKKNGNDSHADVPEVVHDDDDDDDKEEISATVIEPNIYELPNNFHNNSHLLVVSTSSSTTCSPPSTANGTNFHLDHNNKPIEVLSIDQVDSKKVRSFFHYSR